MAPAARLSLPSGARMPSIAIAPARFRVQGWDPILIIAQIVALQSLHYLALAILTPIITNALASADPLIHEGGSHSISMIMDWREFTGLPTVSLPRAAFGGSERFVSLTLAEAGKGWTERMIIAAKGVGGMQVGRDDLLVGLMRVIRKDSNRGWAVAFAWLGASLIDVVFLYHLVRRPTHILDFSLTLLFNHTLLTTYYSSRFPTSLFYWLTLALAAVAQIVLSEQWCVRREMREGFTLDGGGPPSRSVSPALGRSPLPGGETPGMFGAGAFAGGGGLSAASALGRSVGPGKAGGAGGHARGASGGSLLGHSRGQSTGSSNGGKGGSVGGDVEMGKMVGGTRYERVPEEDNEDGAS